MNLKIFFSETMRVSISAIRQNKLRSVLSVLGITIGIYCIIAVYALRNSMVAAVTQIGLLFGALIGGAVAIEYIYDWPGIGSYAVRAVLDSEIGRAHV